MIRLCYVIPSLSVGGTEKQLIALMRGLVKDHEITVICTHHDGALAGDARRMGAFVRVVGSWTGWDFTTQYRLSRVFRAHRPDIVHTFMFGFDLYANRAARATGVPVVVSSRRELATWKKARHVVLQKKANRLVDCVIANSHAVAEFAAKQEGAHPSLFHVIPNGIDADAYVSATDRRQLRLRYDIPFHTHVVGIVANFSPVKDHELFVEAARLLAQRRPDIHFLMVGNGPRVKPIMHLIQTQGLSDRFTRVATVSELPDLYALMDVSVLCSQAEGFPNAVMESMAARLPVVAPAVGGVPELVTNGVTGRLVSTRDPEDFAQAIEWMLDHPDESKAMGQRAGDHVRASFPMEKMVRAYRKLYVELLAASVSKGS